MTVLPEPLREGEQTVEFTVRVRGYGTLDRVAAGAERELCRALHQTFGAGRFDVESGEHLLIFDALADDGHHAGHDDALVRMPKAETFGDRSSVREAPGQISDHRIHRDAPGYARICVHLDLVADYDLFALGDRVLVVPQP